MSTNTTDLATPSNGTLMVAHVSSVPFGSPLPVLPTGSMDPINNTDPCPSKSLYIPNIPPLIRDVYENVSPVVNPFKTFIIPARPFLMNMTVLGLGSLAKSPVPLASKSVLPNILDENSIS